ncbi:hypothetical protein RM844_13600 [Streptomyces sp. DSM 44915]|uniref:Uncharacterized protein n=1 Tax=Streptomyces chisholmiae TaxID=3075540 RepID=A0ABU2JQQ9_9ACTN|nr:hypothetical protein [Streptomyces sp. DSM 44915]MDT0267320.1 hypothetical protein [Streptomyces sp. DSM 44915]
MTALPRNRVRAVAATAAAVLLGLAGAGQAAAAPGGATLHTGPELTGAAIDLDLADAGTCQALPEPARSGVNLSGQDVTLYFHADCRPGAPGGGGDLTYVLGGLHTGTFPYPALSYRVAPAN